MMTDKYTEEEMRDMFIGHSKTLMHYWLSVDGSELSRMEGFLFSLMNVFDGTSGGFPCAIDMTLSPHDDDKGFNISEGNKWIEKGMVINDCMMHELL